MKKAAALSIAVSTIITFGSMWAFGFKAAEQTVSFVSPYTNKLDFGQIKKVEQDVVTFTVKEFVTSIGDATYIRYRNYQSATQNLGFEISDSASQLKLKNTVCLSNKKVLLETLYSNNTAKVMHGDFFGQRMLFFERPEIVKTSDLQNCE